MTDNSQHPNDATFLQVIHDAGAPIDWAIRCSPVTPAAAKLQNNTMR